MSQNKATFLILLTALISGFSIFINKFGVSVINPYIFAGLKNSMVAFLILAWFLIMKDWAVVKKLKIKQWGYLILVGLIGGSIPFLLFFKGLSLTTSIQAGFIHKTMFIFVAVLAFVFLKEKISKNFFVIGLVILLGNILLLRLNSFQFNFGDLLILLATLLWAGENVLSKHLLFSLSPKTVMLSRMFFGSFFIIIFLILTNQFSLIGSLNASQISWTMITSVLLFGYVVTWYTGLKHMPVSRAAVILSLSAPITTILSMIFLNRHVAIGQLAGILLVFVGVALVSKYDIKKELISV